MQELKVGGRGTPLLTSLAQSGGLPGCVCSSQPSEQQWQKLPQWHGGSRVASLLLL